MTRVKRGRARARAARYTFLLTRHGCRSPKPSHSQAAPAYPWGVTSHKNHFQWPDPQAEEVPDSWGSVWRKAETPAGHYRRESQIIGALQTTATGVPRTTHSRSPTMTRMRYLDAPSQQGTDRHAFIMDHASRSNYCMVTDEEHTMRDAVSP